MTIMETATKEAPASKGKRVSTVDRLIAQGDWITVELEDGTKMPAFKMPTPELQSELEEALDGKIKKHLKAGGYERVCATRRDFPFHSEILRQRIDELAWGYCGSAYSTDETAEVTRQEGHADIDRLAKSKAARGNYSYDVLAAKREEDEQTAAKRKRAIREWAKAFEIYRSMWRDPTYYRNTMVERILLPHNGPELPDGPPPKPVYVNKQTNWIIAVRDGLVDLWMKV